MNIISNCCLGAYITRDVLREKYNNPFVWGWLSADDMIYLMYHYSEINWTRTSISVYNNEPIYPECCFQVCVDGKITIVYSHYILSPDCSCITIDSSNNTVRYNRIYEYVMQRYYSRIQRLGLLEPPLFIIADDRTNCMFSNEQIHQLIADPPNKLLLFSSKSLTINHPNIRYYQHNGNMLNDIVKMYYDQIIQFVNS